jgi:hypothetical protein
MVVGCLADTGASYTRDDETDGGREVRSDEYMREAPSVTQALLLYATSNSHTCSRLQIAKQLAVLQPFLVLSLLMNNLALYY